MRDEPNVVVFGAGAIGATVGGWLSERYANVWLLDQPAVVDRLNAEGLSLYCHDTPQQVSKVPVKAITRLSDAPTPDVVLLAVKTYSLDAVCELVKGELGDQVWVVGLQNGIDNQRILPKHFPNALYCVVGYNAWIDAPGKVGYQKRGPLVLGHPEGKHAQEARQLAALLSRGVETVAPKAFQDAVHSKMVINLTNSLQALVGHPLRPITHRPLFQRLLTQLLYEGVRVVRAAGYRECRIGGMPPWALMWAAASLPPLLTRAAFERNLKKMVMSSMAQDVLQRGGHATELEAINGYIMQLADRHGVDVPYNRAVYTLCKERFAADPFTPLSVEEVAEAVDRQLRRAA